MLRDRGAILPVVIAALLLLACDPPPPAGSGPTNIVVVAMDTVRWDHTSLSGYTRDTTPSLTALAALPGATTYTRAFSDAAWSLPAYASLLTGRTALAHGLGFSTMALSSEQATLAEMLTAYGYHTRAYVSGPHLDPAVGLARGFAHYDHHLESASLARSTNLGLSWLAEERDADTPFFLMMQGYDAHYPYRAPGLIGELFAETPHFGNPRCPGEVPGQLCGRIPPRGNRGKSITHAERQHVIAHYDSAILYADYQLGRIVAALSEAGLLESTIIVALSDHGEGLGEDGSFSHDALIGDRVTHVPLVVVQPDGARPRTVDGLVSLSGLVPTLAKTLDIVPPAGSDGVAFDAPAETVRSASMCCYSVRTAEWSLEGPHSGAPAWSLYAEGRGADVAQDHPAVVESLSGALSDWPRDLGDLNALNQKLAEDRPALEAALKEGGYWRP